MPSAEKMSLSSLVVEGESINNQEALKVDAQSLVENNAENLKPSAIPQILSPINAGLQIVQNKIRNLEKRKNKLESYKELEASGNNLNSEQKKAVAKYDEVIQHLEISKDFCKQFQTIATTASKEAKREARKSGFVRQQQETNKIREVLLIQETIAQLLDCTVRNDFLSGRNGACKVGVSELEFLNKFGKLMSPVRPAYSNETTFSNSVKSVAEHLCNVADGRPRPFADSGYTYDKIKDLLTKIQSCGYFEKNIKFVAEEKVAVECEVVAVDEQESENDESEGKAEEQKDVVQQVQPAPIQSQIPTQAFAVTLPVVQSAPIPVVQPQQQQQSTGIAANNKNQPPTTVRAVEHQYFVQNQMKYVQQSPQQQQQQQHHQVPIIPVQQQQQHPNKPLAPNNPIHDVISSGNFFFLQDSELDAPAEVQLPKQQGGKIISLPTTVVQSPQLPPTIQQQQHQQQQQPQSTISTQTFTNQNYHQQQQQQQPRENVVHSTQIYAPPGLNLQPQGVPQQQQTAHIPNYQSTQQHSTNQSQASSQIIPNQQQQQKQQIAGFATVQSSVNPQQPRPYPPILPPVHFQHMQQQQQQKTQAQPLPNEQQQQQLQQNVQKLDSDSSSLQQQQQQQQSNMDSQQTRSPPMQEQEKKRDDWSAQQQQPPQIDTWTNETANGAPSSSTNSNYNSTRPSSGYNRSSGGGNRTSGGNDRKYGNGGGGGVQSNGGYRGNNGIQDNYRSSHQSRSNNNNNNNNSNGSGDTTSAPNDGTSNRSQPMGGTNGGGDTFYRNNGDRGYQNGGGGGGGGNGGNGGGRYDQSRGGYNSKPRNMDNAMNSRGNGGGPAPAGTQTQNRYGPRSGGSANAGQREAPRK